MDDFIKVWNKANSPKEVAEILNQSYSFVTRKASNLRKQGYKVKKFTFDQAYFKRIGAIGGRNSKGGFAANRELARIAGAIGGRRSRRNKKESQ